MAYNEKWEMSSLAFLYFLIPSFIVLAGSRIGEFRSRETSLVLYSTTNRIECNG
jgi:hypothetical protein